MFEMMVRVLSSYDKLVELVFIKGIGIKCFCGSVLIMK
jgi:hypothetical protein